MLEQTRDSEEVIARIAALDIGKAELVCCARVPDPAGTGRRAQEVSTHSTITRSLLGLADRLHELGVTRVVMRPPPTTGSRRSTCWKRTGSRCGW